MTVVRGCIATATAQGYVLAALAATIACVHTVLCRVVHGLVAVVIRLVSCAFWNTRIAVEA